MGTWRAIFCRRDVAFLFIGLTMSALTASVQGEVAEEYQKCVTSCTDEDGYSMNTGNYPHCERCNIYVSCNSGYMNIRDCPLGTNYFNRKLGVCDTNISVCVNDSLTTKSTQPMTMTTISSSTSGQVILNTTVIITTTTPTTDTTTSTTSETVPTTTSTSVTQTSSSPETTSSTNPTFPETTATTITSETSTTSTLLTTTSTTPTVPTTSTLLTTTSTTPTVPTTNTVATTSTTLPTTTSTSVIQTSSSQATTTPTSPAVPITLAPVTAAYIPKPGGEADSFWFAMNMFNNHSQDAVRVGALTVDSLSATYSGSDQLFAPGTDYRIYGVMLIKTVCPNKPEFTKASPTECPLMSTVSGKANPYFAAKCHFKVRHSSPNTAAAKLAMMYMMCDK